MYFHSCLTNVVASIIESLPFWEQQGLHISTMDVTVLGSYFPKTASLHCSNSTKTLQSTSVEQPCTSLFTSVRIAWHALRVRTGLGLGHVIVLGRFH